MGTTRVLLARTRVDVLASKNSRRTELTDGILDLANHFVVLDYYIQLELLAEKSVTVLNVSILKHEHAENHTIPRIVSSKEG